MTTEPIPPLTDETRQYLAGIWGPLGFVWCVALSSWHAEANPCRAGEHHAVPITDRPGDPS